MARTNSKKIKAFNISGKMLLTAIFLYACYSKILDPETFIKNITAYGILPTFLINPFGHSVPFLELFSSILLWIPTWSKSALLIMALMLLSFIIAIAFAMITNKNINCGCFDTDQAAGPMQLTIDLFLLLDIILLYFFTNVTKTISPTDGN